GPFATNPRWLDWQNHLALDFFFRSLFEFVSRGELRKRIAGTRGIGLLFSRQSVNELFVLSTLIPRRRVDGVLVRHRKILLAQSDKSDWK
ncbi:MAG: hypothetical protein HKN47_15670, partial [Pirellulaceae bacterium]|nr:hypothetical protein [Pirellulaceae bacterium]